MQFKFTHTCKYIRYNSDKLSSVNASYSTFWNLICELVNNRVEWGKINGEKLVDAEYSREIIKINQEII